MNVMVACFSGVTLRHAVRTIMLTLCCCCALFGHVDSLVTTVAASSASHLQDDARTTLPLVNWLLFSTADPSEIYAVTVPNTVLGALTSTSRYPFDPFYGKNLQLINETDFMVPWVFTTSFKLSNASSQRVILQLEGLNYKSELRVNQVLVANSSYLIGAFRRYELDITPFISSSIGTLNNISIQVMSQTHSPGEWRSFNTDLSINFQDWNPHPPDLSMGIYRQANLLIFDEAPATSQAAAADGSSPQQQPMVTIDGVVVKTVVPPTLPGQTVVALLNASFVVRLWSPATATTMETFFYFDFGFNVTLQNGTTQRVVAKTPLVNLSAAPASSPLSPSETRVYVSWESNSMLVVENPLLWWPWQMGEQNLINGAIVASDGATQLRTFTYGMRDVRTELNQGGALQFFINNVPLQFRGGGWNSDLFLREKSSNRLTKEFTMLREMGLNGLRLEGMLETDLFYDIADAFGILLLPGMPCCDGWQNWTSWPEANYAIARQSVVDQVRRISIHPSVVGFFEASDSLPPQDVEEMYLTAFVEESWPNALISSASQEISNVSGNPGVKMVGPYSWEPPSYWLVDGNGLVDGNYGGAWGFFTEGGPGESPMTFASWNRTVPVEYQWNSTTQSMDSWWSFHMGEPYGHFRNLTFYTPPLNARYGPSTSAQSFLYRAQAANYEGIRAYIESYSRNKHLNATGFVQWMVNNAWPSHLWHLYDYYLTAGGGYYGAKAACKDLHVMMSYNDGSIWIVNSRFYDVGEVSITAEVISLTGEILSVQTQTVPTIPSDASFPLTGIAAIPLNGQPWFNSTGDTFFVRLQWYYQDQQQVLKTKENWYWLSPAQDVMDFPASNGFRTPCTSYTNFTQLNVLPPASVAVTLTSESSQGLMITLAAAPNNTAVAFFVHVRLVNTTTGFDVSPQYWDDNYITLLPGASRALSVRTILDDVLPLSEIDIVVESWNSQVANA